MRKALIQFDGSNFYNKAKKMLPQIHLTHFDYSGLAKLITKEKHIDITYYVGEIRQYPNNKKSKILYSNQQKLFTNLRKQNITIKLGYLLMSSGVFHEKGVDVQIAVDIVRGAIKNEYDIFYLISSDTDLIPAIQTAKEEEKKVVYVGFENSISRALIKNCSSHVILKKKQILQLIPNN
ncbi:NYN domain-containing protein [Patescibacteria group bacterium]|nr:NYN domain-containing protein [Patescibacteria group bacterium]MBU4017393.1 NYN domain-containing protein [Patescibacteria group bacterium]MBU4098555.1 NYN domain-containing protein [Patescibacteria group bacterium]